mmetsp:Transcript_11437/g.17103  ORF Transcript_11437/g.17103 Transcript_11437/m.17103 type:complete len:91 (+) Transcript_11437:109-381(+)
MDRNKYTSAKSTTLLVVFLSAGTLTNIALYIAKEQRFFWTRFIGLLNVIFIITSSCSCPSLPCRWLEYSAYEQPLANRIHKRKEEQKVII